MSENEPTKRDEAMKPRFEILPERQAKITSLFNTNMDWDMHSYCKPVSSQENTVYCICRSKDTSRFMICCDHCNEWYHGDCVGITEKRAKNIVQYCCSGCKDIDPELETKYLDRKPKQHLPSEKKRDGRKEGGKRKARRCGECIACYRVEDCGRCDFCKDMRKFGGPNKVRQKCRQRQCLNFGLVIGRKMEQKKHQFQDKDISDDESSPRVLKDINYDEEEEDEEENDEELYQPQKKKGRKKVYAKKSPSKRGQSQKRGRKRKDQDRHHKRHGHSHGDEHDRRRHRRRGERTKDSKSKLSQCFGPSCTQAARTGSKFCSEECGIKLAMNRIYHILPQRIQQWNSMPCAAEDNSKKQLEKIRNQQVKAQQLLGQLDRKSHFLEALIERAKQTPLAPEQENPEGDEEAELSFYCVTCGLQTGTKPALRHMEKCFNKYESQTSFGSVFKTRIEAGYNMFCDAYNAQQGTYCKRLRVLCPEHTKDPKINEDEVCGCPLVTNVFQETGEFCRLSRKKCNKHYCWEKLRRAEIDMDRVRQWLMLDDLLEQERSILLAMANRAGVLGLMLHSTVTHDEAAPNLISASQVNPMNVNLPAV